MMLGALTVDAFGLVSSWTIYTQIAVPNLASILLLRWPPRDRR